MSTQPRSYGAAHFLLELDRDQVAGFVHSVDGGSIKGEIITHKVGPTSALFRQIGRPKYEDLKLEVGMSMSEVFYTWLEAFFTGKIERATGAIVAADFNFKARARREFAEALISELAFPALDATSTSAVHMTVTMVPERVRFAKANEEVIQAAKLQQQEHKLWTGANFTLTIDGLEQACARVTKIDGFSIKQDILEYQAGNLKDALRVPGALEFPNLTFEIPEVDARVLTEELTERVVDGKPAPPARRNGELRLLDHKSEELCSISMTGIDVAGITPEKSDATSEELKKVKVEISVESMKFKYARPAT
jgi:phage tail-like protein